MSDDGKVIDIWDWRPALKPGELPRGCALVSLPTPPQTEQNEQPRRKLRPSEVALTVALVGLISLLIASFI